MADSKLETRVSFDTQEDHDRAYPYKPGLVARRMLRAMHVVKPRGFPVVRVLPIQDMYRRGSTLISEQLSLEARQPGADEVIAELRGFRLDLGKQIRDVEQANWDLYDR